MIHRRGSLVAPVRSVNPVEEMHMHVRRLVPLLALTLGACDKGSDSTGSESDADTDADSDTDTDSDTDLCKTDICATYGGSVPVVAGIIVDTAANDPEFQAFFAPL